MASSQLRRSNATGAGPADLEAGLPGLALRLPPLWPAEVVSQGLGAAREVQRLRAGGEGRVEVVNLRRRLRSFLRQKPAARIRVSAGELGAAVLLLYWLLAEEGRPSGVWDSAWETPRSSPPWSASPVSRGRYSCSFWRGTGRG